MPCYVDRLFIFSIKTSVFRLLPLSIALLYVTSDAGEIGVEGGLIAVVDDLDEVLQLGTDLLDMVLGAGVEEDLTEEGVVLAQHASGYAEMALEGGTGGILVLHDGTEDEGADEGYGETVGHGFVVLLEGVLVDVQTETAIEVEEEYTTKIVAFIDNNGIFCV